MKNLIIILLSSGLAFGVSAQPKLGVISQNIGAGIKSNGGNIHSGTKSVIVMAPAYRYNPYAGIRYRNYYAPRFGFGYPAIYDPFYLPQQQIERQPTELDLAIEEIKEEYDYRIDTVKEDKALSKDVRKQKVRDLKHQRADAIIEAKKLYYYEKDQKRNK